MRQMRERLLRATGSNERTPVREVIRRTYTLLARAPSVVVTATLEDAMATEARPNMPGTVSEWPNWRQPLPKRLEVLARDPNTNAIAAGSTRLPDARPLRTDAPPRPHAAPRPPLVSRRVQRKARADKRREGSVRPARGKPCGEFVAVMQCLEVAVEELGHARSVAKVHHREPLTVGFGFNRCLELLLS